MLFFTPELFKFEYTQQYIYIYFVYIKDIEESFTEKIESLPLSSM